MDFYMTLFTSICVNLVAILSMFMLIGLTGIFSMGQAAFMCVGAYATGLVAVNFNIPMVFGLLIAVLVGMLFAFVVGMPVIRLRTDYVALITLGFGEAVVALLNNTSNITGGSMGINGIPQKLTAGIAASILIIVLYVVINFKNSKYGRQCIAIKNDEISAASMGIDVNRIKLMTFVIAGGITALSGGMLAYLTTYVEPMAYGSARSIDWISVVFIGGINSLTGALISGAIFGILPEALRFADALRIVAQCVIVILVINFMPNGIFGGYEITDLFKLCYKKISSLVSKKKVKED